MYHGEEHIETTPLVCGGGKAEQCARLRAGRVHLEGSAESLKRSAKASERRKGTPFQYLFGADMHSRSENAELSATPPLCVLCFCVAS